MISACVRVRIRYRLRCTIGGSYLGSNPGTLDSGSLSKRHEHQNSTCFAKEV